MQMIATSGRSGTRHGYYNHKGGYKLHFEVIQSKERIKWVEAGPLDFHSVSESMRTDPEAFLRRASEDFMMNKKGKYTVKLSNGNLKGGPRY